MNTIKKTNIQLHDDPPAGKWRGLASLIILAFPGLLFFFIWVDIAKIIPLGFALAGHWVSPDAFLYVYPDDTGFVWPGFWVLGGLLAFFPVNIFLTANTVFLLGWLWDRSQGNPEKMKTKKINLSFGKVMLWFTLPLMPFVIYGLLRFYYVNPAGVHHYQWPHKTVDYPWNSVKDVTMRARGSDEVNGYQIQYDLHLKEGETVPVRGQYFQNFGNEDLAKSFLALLRHIKTNPDIKITMDISQKGALFLQSQLGEGARDILGGAPLNTNPAKPQQMPYVPGDWNKK